MAAITAHVGLDLGVPHEIKDRALAYLVVMMENTHADRLDEDVGALGRAARRARRARRVRAAAGSRPRSSSTPARRRSGSAKANGADDIVDIVVPRAAIPEFMAQGRRARRRRTGRWIAGCGHAGDGNVHLSVFQADPERALRRCCAALFEAGMALGGAISGEHGIGTAKKRVLPRARGPGQARADAPHQGRVRPRTASSTPARSSTDADGGRHHERCAGADPDARRQRRRRVLHEPGHVGDALRRRARRGARDARRCSACSRASSPARPTATAAWPAGRRRRCCTSGPGLGNGLANLHNARRAHTPIVNIVGDHATYHKQYDAPLESDIETRRAGTCRAGSGASAGTGDVGRRRRRGRRRRASARPGRSPR